MYLITHVCLIEHAIGIAIATDAHFVDSIKIRIWCTLFAIVSIGVLCTIDTKTFV